MQRRTETVKSGRRPSSTVRVLTPSTELTIDRFDQWHNPDGLRLWPSNWAAPLESVDAAA